MLYRYLCSKKGFTMMEILVVVLVLGILVAVAVPLFSNVIEIRRKQDCQNQRVIVEGLVFEALTGMMDNGKSQKNSEGKFRIDFNKISDPSHLTTYPETPGDADNDYEGKKCLMLAPTGDNYVAFTLGDIRGGYRDDPDNTDYSEGCEKGNYLKKEKLENVMFYTYCVNHEPPICPFSDNDAPVYYYIFEDGTVLCPNEACHED